MLTSLAFGTSAKGHKTFNQLFAVFCLLINDIYNRARSISDNSLVQSLAVVSYQSLVQWGGTVGRPKTSELGGKGGSRFQIKLAVAQQTGDQFVAKKKVILLFWNDGCVFL